MRGILRRNKIGLIVFLVLLTVGIMLLVAGYVFVVNGNSEGSYSSDAISLGLTLTLVGWLIIAIAVLGFVACVVWDKPEVFIYGGQPY